MFRQERVTLENFRSPANLFLIIPTARNASWFLKMEKRMVKKKNTTQIKKNHG
jgi:hypothetical protein